MKIEEAEKTLREEYVKACAIEWVQSPVAYALYRAWRKADEDDRFGLKGIMVPNDYCSKGKKNEQIQKRED